MRETSALLVFATLLLAGCTGPVIMGSGAAMILATSPDEPPPADTEHQMPAHESWCYSTLGDIECYPRAQDVSPSRLVGVDPPQLRPLTAQEYHEEVRGRRARPAQGQPVMLTPDAPTPVESNPLPPDAPASKL